MFESDTHEADEANEARETDEARYTPAVTTLVTVWYHRKHGVHAMTAANTGESMVKDALNAGKSFFGGFEKAREKNFIFAVDASESDCPPRQNTLKRRNQAVEALAAIQTNNFANNNNNNNNNYCYHSVNNTHYDQPQKSSLLPGWLQREIVEVGK